MNKIVMIGNGFDLAHGLKTKYSDFIDSILKEIIDGFMVALNIDRKFENEFVEIDCRVKFIQPNYQIETVSHIIEAVRNSNGKFIYKNKFFQSIVAKKESSWVDIEEEYYKFLLFLIKGKMPEYKETLISLSHDYDINKLNEEFSVIKERLTNYLESINEIDKFIISKIRDHLVADFKFQDLSETAKEAKVDSEFRRISEIMDRASRSTKTLNEFDPIVSRIVGNNASWSLKEHIFDLFNSNSVELLEYTDMSPNNIVLLNFNYTNTVKMYENLPGYISEINYIHGSIESIEKNPIIFGFGDEMDKVYQEIESTNNSQYLNNVKSINYLQDSKYKELLNIVNGDTYQLCIMGLSCGVSDRTLLNTLFEHKNCASVKIYYHKKNTDEDNFKEITQNISRIFRDKSKMRDSVVNKLYSDSLT